MDAPFLSLKVVTALAQRRSPSMPVAALPA
jgi:hypothetical protein